MEKYSLRIILKSILRYKVSTQTNGQTKRLYAVFKSSVDQCRLLSARHKLGVNELQNFHKTALCEEIQELPVIIPPSKYKTRSDEKIKKISNAMRAYIQRAQEHDAFMKQQTEEFEMGKRHLANMMGVDADHMTQNDVDEAISYLMPSGLFEPKARPFMKHPEVVFPKRKAAEFDMSGRPFHFLFYTSKPCYYQTLHDIAVKIEKLDAFEDNMIRQGVLHPHSEMKLVLTGSEWVTLDDLKKKLAEEFKEDEYNYFIISITRLTQHPYSYREKDFIMNYRKILAVGVTELPLPPLTIDDKGQNVSTATGKRKTSVATVTVHENGTGKVKINGQDIRYFESFQDREQLLFPLQFTGLLEKVDFEAEVNGGGHSSQAGAVRYALAQALLNFVGKNTIEEMRIAGLLTRDPRRRERDKPGQKGARAKYTWKKR